ncbi:hypothetical protein AMTRI_Chr01g131260 [Amborella trichopoda]
MVAEPQGWWLCGLDSLDLESLFGDLPLMRKNLFGGSNEMTYHSWVKEGVYYQCYLHSRVCYAALLGGI